MVSIRKEEIPRPVRNSSILIARKCTDLGRDEAMLAVRHAKRSLRVRNQVN